MATPTARVRPYQPLWFLAEVRTGQLLQELVTLDISGSVGRTLGQSTSGSFTLYLPRTTLPWREYTQPGRWMVVGILDDRPFWAGIILQREGGTNSTVDLTCTSPEGYLDRRYVHDHTWSQKDEASVIATGLLQEAVSPDGICLRIDAPATGTKRDRTYLDTGNKTVYAAMQELMGVRSGPEWSIDPEWVAGAEGQQVELVARVRKHYGRETAAVVFDYPGPIVEYTTSESYDAGSGANEVLADGAQETPEATVDESAGEDDVDDVGDVGDVEEVETIFHRSKVTIAQAVLDAGWPRYAYRWQPSTSITEQSTLDTYAADTCSALAWGTEAWTVTLAASVAPRLAEDWDLGDQVRVVVEQSAFHPQGAEYEGRIWAWELDTAGDRITPTIAVENPNDTGTETEDEDEDV